MKLFIVKTKCGHVGKNKYIVIDFPVAAENGKEAAGKARNFPRVKHHQKDAILDVKEVCLEEFLDCVQKCEDDEYLLCSNRQEQRMIDGFMYRVIEDNTRYKKTKTNDNKWFHKTCVRNFKKYYINNIEVTYEY